MGYTLISNDILKYNISQGALKLYFILESMCFGDKVECFPSQQYLAKKMNRSIRSIQRYLKELIENNIILKKRRGSISNIYSVVLKKNNTIISNIVNKIKSFKSSNKESRSTTFSNKTFSKKPVTRTLKGPNWNTEERNYNFDNLEKMLLGYQDYNVSELYK